MEHPDTAIEDGLKSTHKILIFFFGVVIVLFAGHQYVYNLPGNKKQKREGLLLYYAGLLFYVLCVGIIYYISSHN